jgi:hypothetical protein
MIREELLGKMFSIANISRTELHAALREMGAPPKRCKDIWHAERPTIGYCYVVSEVVSYLMKSRGILHKAYRLDCGNGESHWFIRVGNGGNGAIIDLTADQSDEAIKYDEAKPRGFQKNSHMQYGMSKQAVELAKKLHIL